MLVCLVSSLEPKLNTCTGMWTFQINSCLLYVYALSFVHVQCVNIVVLPIEESFSKVLFVSNEYVLLGKLFEKLLFVYLIYSLTLFLLLQARYAEVSSGNNRKNRIKCARPSPDKWYCNESLCYRSCWGKICSCKYFLLEKNKNCVQSYCNHCFSNIHPPTHIPLKEICQDSQFNFIIPIMRFCYLNT